MTRTDAQGNFRFEKISPGAYTINPIREGVTFSPTNRPVSATLAGISGLAFIANPDNIVVEARKDIGMPYSLNRGCEFAVPGMRRSLPRLLPWRLHRSGNRCILCRGGI